jgi:proteasome assembly chaperone (PAC2) family protein
MNEPYRFDVEVPTLREPVLIVSLTGWIDASGAAVAATAAAMQSVTIERLATFDADTFVDFRARRPTMEIREGLNSALVWPEITLEHGVTSWGRDLLFLTGPEPDSAWHRFADAVVDVAQRLGVTQAIGLGAYPFATPHTRPSRLSCTTPDPDLLARVPFLKSTVDVPAGMAAALERALCDAGIPSIGIWVQVPHYVSAMSYPAASLALLEGVRHLTGIEIDAPSLRQEAIIQRQRLDDLVAANPEHMAMLHKLEEVIDSVDDSQPLPLPDERDLPSGDELAAELEQFLRDSSD